MSMTIARHVWILLALALTACAAPGAVQDPVGRKLSWFSYLNGDDLRASCREGELDRFRMVFNADYNEHVRTYDIVGDGKGGAVMEARVIAAPDLSRVNLADPVAAWRGRIEQTRLTPGQFAALVLSLYESGAFDSGPGGLRLSSSGFYWLAGGCRGGQWFFAAYPYPSDRFANVRFEAPLRALDPTGVAFPTLPPPGSILPAMPQTRQDRDDDGVFFELTTSAGGLVGPTHLFGAWPFGGAVTPPGR